MFLLKKIICRSQGKILVAVNDENIGDSCKVEAKALSQNNNLLPYYSYQTDVSGKNMQVVVLPHFECPVNLRVSSGKLSAASTKTLQPTVVAVASKANYLLRRAEALSIRDSDRDELAFKAQIDFTNCVQTSDEIIIRGEALSPIFNHEDFSIEVLDNDFNLLDIQLIKMGEFAIPNDSDHPHDIYSLSFSAKFTHPFKGCTFILKDSDNKIRAIESVTPVRLSDLIYETALRTSNAVENPDYGEWYEANLPSKAQISSQKSITWSYEPLISIVVPIFNTPLQLFSEMIESVTAQSYQKWELVLVNASPENRKLASKLSSAAESNHRIKVVSLDSNLGISKNTKAGIDAASGEFVAFLDHDDIITPNALFEYVKALNANPALDVFYSDIDVLDFKGKHIAPYFKPDFSPFLLRQVNYMAHFRMVRRSLLDEVELDNSTYDGAQDHHMLLQCINKTNNVFHCPKVLYSWRQTETSAASSTDAKPYANTAARLAIRKHLADADIKAEIIDSADACRFNIKYNVIGNPKVSIIIPNKDNSEMLNRCIDSIETKSTYSNYEIIIVENNSIEDETFSNYQSLLASYSNIKLITWEHEFNYSKINNFATEHAEGEYLLFLNNDTQVISNDWIEELLGTCQQPEVGAVGALLLYPDGLIQHGGVYVQGDGAGHLNWFLHPSNGGYFKTIITVREVSAVTAACLMCSRETFVLAEGFDEKFGVAFNDVDFCMKIRDLGLSIIYNPLCKLYHYESLSRGYEVNQEKILRFNREASRLRYKWSDQYVVGDPFMNPNLRNDNCHFKLNEYLGH